MSQNEEGRPENEWKMTKYGRMGLGEMGNFWYNY